MRAELRAHSESLPRVSLWAQCVKMGATWPWALMQAWWVTCLICWMKTKVKSPNLRQKRLIPLFTGMWYICNLEAVMGVLTTLISWYCRCGCAGLERKESLKRGLMESAPDPNGLPWIQGLVKDLFVCQRDWNRMGISHKLGWEQLEPPVKSGNLVH